MNRFIEISEIELRKAFNAMLTEELNEKGYDVVFYKDSLKIKAIHHRKKDVVKHKFERLKVALKKKYNINIEYTDTYCLRSISFIYNTAIDHLKETEQAA